MNKPDIFILLRTGHFQDVLTQYLFKYPFNNSTHINSLRNIYLLDILCSVHYHVHMKSKTYTEAREKLSDIIEKVCEDHDPIIITKRRDKAVVMISLEDYETLKETSYLLRSPRNARRLLESIKELEDGKGIQKEIFE
jgi:antitoxin YefM